MSGENSGLPPGWVKKHDPKKDKDYYYHAETKKTQWTPPEGTVSITAQPDNSTVNANVESLPPGWIKKHDAKKDKDYYYHAETKTTQWNPPEPVEAVAQNANVEASSNSSGAASIPKTESGGLPPGWVKKHDAKRDKDYYYHAATKVTQWTPPEGTGASANESLISPTGAAASLVENNGLPAGWVKKHDLKKDKDYYYHAETKKTQWTPPEGTNTAPAAASATDVGASAAGGAVKIENGGLPAGWVKKHDPKKDKDYYYHAETKKTQWTPPEGTVIQSELTSTGTSKPAATAMASLCDWKGVVWVMDGESGDLCQVTLRGFGADADIGIVKPKPIAALNPDTAPPKPPTTEKKRLLQDPLSIGAGKIIGIVLNQKTNTVTISYNNSGPAARAASLAGRANKESEDSISQVSWVNVCASAGLAFIDSMRLRVSGLDPSMEIHIVRHESSVVGVDRSVETLVRYLRLAGKDGVGTLQIVQTCADWLRAHVAGLVGQLESLSGAARGNDSLHLQLTAHQIALQELVHLGSMLPLMGASNPATKTCHIFVPQNGLLVVRFNLSSQLSVTQLDGNFTNKLAIAVPRGVATGVFMSFWVTISEETRELSLFDRGSDAKPLLVLALASAAIVVSSTGLSSADNEHCVTIEGAALIQSKYPLQFPSQASDKDRQTVSLSFKFQDLQEMVYWVLSAGSKCKFIDYSKLMQSISNAGNVSGKMQIVDESHSSLMAFAMAVFSSSAEHAMVTSGIRRLSACGAALKSVKFQTINNRAIVAGKGEMLDAQLVEGSLLLSVNTLSALSTSAHICLKFLVDLPRALPATIALWKFPRFQKVALVSGFVDENAVAASDAVASMIVRLEGGYIVFQAVDRNSTDRQTFPRLLLSSCQLQIISKLDSGLTYLALRITANRSNVVIHNKDPAIMASLVTRILYAAKLLGSLPVDLPKLIAKVESKHSSTFLKATDKPTSNQDDDEDEDAYNDTRVGDYGESAVPNVVAECDELALVQAVDGLQSLLQRLNLSPICKFPKTATVKQIVDAIRHTNLANHELLMKLIPLESGAASSAPPSSGDRTIDPIEAASPIPMSHSSMMHMHTVDINNTSSSTTSNKIAAEDLHATGLDAIHFGDGAQAVVLTRTELQHASRIIMYLRHNPRSVYGMFRAAKTTEKSDLARIMICRVLSHWSSDESLVQSLVSSVAALDAKNPYLADRSMGPDSLYSSMLVNEISHRVDVVISFRQICDSLESVEAYQPALQPVGNGAFHRQPGELPLVKYISDNISDICKGIVEPFCSRLLSFALDGRFPRIVSSTMAALATAQANLASGQFRLRSSTSTPIKPSAFLCDCIVPSFAHWLTVKFSAWNANESNFPPSSSVSGLVARVMDLLLLCFNQNPAKQFPLCLSDQAAISRCKWLIAKCVDHLVECGDRHRPSVSEAEASPRSVISLLSGLQSLSSPTTTTSNAVVAVKPSIATGHVCMCFFELNLLLGLFARSVKLVDGSVPNAVADIIAEKHLAVLRQSMALDRLHEACSRADGHANSDSLVEVASNGVPTAGLQAILLDDLDDPSLWSANQLDAVNPNSKFREQEQQPDERDQESILLSELTSLQWLVHAAKEIISTAYKTINGSDENNDDASTAGDAHHIEANLANINRISQALNRKESDIKSVMLDFERLELTMCLLEANQKQITILLDKLNSELVSPENATGEGADLFLHNLTRAFASSGGALRQLADKQLESIQAGKPAAGSTQKPIDQQGLKTKPSVLPAKSTKISPGKLKEIHDSGRYVSSSQSPNRVDHSSQNPLWIMLQNVFTNAEPRENGQLSR